MSQINQVTPKDLEGYPVTNLTLVVLLLIPCVVILLLLNCLFLGYKLLTLSKRSRRLDPGTTEEMLLQSNLQRVARLTDDYFVPQQEPRRAYMSLSEPVLTHPVTSSRASSRERVGVDPRFRLLRPDGATGSGSLRAPSTIRATSSAARFSPRAGLPSRTYSISKAARCRSAPAFPSSTDSEAEVRMNLVPPNSPEVKSNNNNNVQIEKSSPL